MMKLIFDLVTTPLSLFDNMYLNWLFFAIIDEISFFIAWNVVGSSGLRGNSGSELHWSIRLGITIFTYIICCILINIFVFIINNWIYFLISFILVIILIIFSYISKNNPNSVFNKKII